MDRGLPARRRDRGRPCRAARARAARAEGPSAAGPRLPRRRVRPARRRWRAHVAAAPSPRRGVAPDLAAPRADRIRFRAWHRASTFSRTPPTPTARWRRQRGRARRARRRRAAGAVRPRHRHRRLRGDRRRRALRRARGSRGGDLGRRRRRRGPRANCTSSATASTTPDPLLAERLPSSSPTASSARCAWPAACASSAWSSTNARSSRARAAGQPIGRPHLAEAVLACPANAARLQRGGHRRHRLADQGLPDRGPARLSPARDAHRRAGDRGDPRRRRRGRVGAPLLGRLQEPDEVLATHRPLPRAAASTAWRPST